MLYPLLLEAGIQVTVLTDDEIKEHMTQRFVRPGLNFEGLTLKVAKKFARRTSTSGSQWLLAYLPHVGGSWRINTAAMDSHIWEVWAENAWKFRLGVWLPAAV